MRGTNIVASQFADENGRLLVHSLFATIQGEGPDVGMPALFMRLTSCNLRCFWCDTEFSTGTWYDLSELKTWIKNFANHYTIVITGGEPLLQNIVPFVVAANYLGFSVSIETTGTMYVDGLYRVFRADRSICNNLIVCSPKTPALNDKIVPLVGAWKYIIRANETAEDGLPIYSTQERDKKQRLFRPPSDHPAPIFVQPCDETGLQSDNHPELRNPDYMNKQAAVRVAAEHGYRLSIQVHKVLDLP